MRKLFLVALALAGQAFIAWTAAAQFGASVISYDPGSGFTPGYTTPAAALGAPATSTPGPFGGPVDPFAPPFLPDQIVSLGAGGSITLQLDQPIINQPANPFGIDFIIFGNSGFIITNNNYTGGGITDGSLFGSNPGSTRIEVSQDGVSWYTLDSSQAPAPDGFYPTDGAGNPQVPVDPALDGTDFGGLGLGGIRSLYHGSAGGTGYDLGWAQDELGVPVELANANYVRLAILSGSSEIDAISVVPEPACGALAAIGFGLLLRRVKGKATA